MSAAADVVEAARSLVGLHATDPATVFLAARARVPGMMHVDLERALYDDRSLVRMLGMRRTMWVQPLELVPVVHASASLPLVTTQRRRLVQELERSGITDAPEWLGRTEADAVAALGARGEATASELATAVPALRHLLEDLQGSGYVTTRVLVLLGLEGLIVRGRPRGTWLSSQYRWAPTTGWLRGAIATVAPAEARAELVRRWLHAFGPAPVSDLRWWTGWTAKDVRVALTAVGASEVDIDGAIGVVLEGDDEPVPEPEPWVALLPALDPTTMGWSQRRWYLDDRVKLALFDRSGNAGPTVWADGRVVGGWSQRPDGEVVWQALEDVGAEARAAIDAEADRLGRWFAGTRVSPRFPTPLFKELGQ